MRANLPLAGMNMDKVRTFIQKERLYFLLIAFIIILNIAVLVGKEKSKPASAAGKAGLESVKAKAPAPAGIIPGTGLSREDVERIFSRKRHLPLLFSLAFLFALAVFILGLVVDAILVSMKLSGGGLNIRTNDPGRAPWGLWDVCKVVILFLFFSYMTIMIESALAAAYPALKSDHLRMMLNSSIMDVLAVVLILYFSVAQYKERLSSLGLTFRGLFKNISCGLAAYAAAVPALIAALVMIALVSNAFRYVPPKQPVVELFMKETNPVMLVYTGIFASTLGPVVEELFFRAFMYGALKKYMGIFWAMAVSSLFFAALHAHPAGFLPIMILGMTLVYIYEKTGSLVSSIAVHAAHNFAMVFLVFLVKQLVT